MVRNLGIWIRNLPTAALVKLVRLYQVSISPFFGPSCRFYPSCSAYAILAIKKFGVIKGVYLVAYRLGRCQPLCKGGVDFPPERFSWVPSRNVNLTSMDQVDLEKA